jgi:endogenous inhibitor of DNA gyrase (YacG/DUF329 family)
MKEIDAIDPARSSYREFQLPTGYIDNDGKIYKDCVVREMTGHEEDILMSSSKKSFQKTQAILENCIVKIGDITQESLHWSSIVKSLVHTDRLYALVQIRMASLGDSLSFEVECPECTKTSIQKVSLEEFKVLSAPDSTSRSWSGTLPKSRLTYTARIQTGFDDEKVIKDKDRDDAVSVLIAQRLVDLGGKSPVTIEMAKALPMADRQFIRSEVKKREGKMDDEIEIECPSCDHKFQSNIDLGSPNFFFPSET